MIARIETSADKIEQCTKMSDNLDCWKNSSTYKFVTGHDLFFNDLGGRISGTKLINGEVVSFDEITQFVFSDCQYRVKED